jgi:hypothetical protein
MIMKTFFYSIFLLSYIFLNSAYSNTVIFPPSQYVCNPDSVGNCWCEQHESQYFPQKIEAGFICKNQKNTVKKFYDLTMLGVHQPSQAVAIYGHPSVEYWMSLYSNIDVYRGSSSSWEQAPAAPWTCGDRSCDLVVKP